MRFSALFRPYWRQLMLGLLALITTNLFALILPRLVNMGISVIEGKKVPYFTSITSIVLAILALAVLAAIARTYSRILMFGVGREIERDVRRDVFVHLSTLSPSFYEKRSVGDLMSHMTSDINNIRMCTGFAVLNILNIVIVFAGTAPVLFSIDHQVAFAALLPFPLVMITAQALSGRMFQRVREYQASLSDLSARIQENLSGAQVVRVFHQEEAENTRFAAVNDHAFRAAIRLAKMRVVMFPLMRMMGALGVAVTLFVGGRAVVLGHIDLGDYVEINARLLQLAWPAISLGFVMSVYSRGQASLARMNVLLEARPEIVGGALPAPKQVVRDSADQFFVVAHNLSVQLPQSAKPILYGVSFTVKPGEVLGVVGPTGAGKSTLTRALCREVNVARGQLLIDGQDICDWQLHALRKFVAVAPSEAFLFSASMRSNITFARPDASQDEVMEVVRMVDLTRDVDGFADGLETMIGERGVTLSGGQRQRVALARAILARPKMLILDDCLSAVDAQTQSTIVERLKQPVGDGTHTPPAMIIVSHRLSVVQEANEIVVLDKGQIVERGTHLELLTKGALYRALWGLQLLEEELG